MDLPALVRSLRALHDLPRLFAAVGYEPLWQELPSGALLARAGGFWWIGWEGAAGTAQASRAAARLARGGRVAGVAMLDPHHRTLDLAVGFHGDPGHRIHLDAPTAVDAERLERCRPGYEQPALATAARVAEALAGEEAGRRFFHQFRRTLHALRDALPHAIPVEDRHALALTQMSRVLVLYFLQAKGWLDGRERFLREEVDRCLAGGRSIHRDLLRPLFFGTLNRPVDGRSPRVRRLGRIPFLNGGLFEPLPLEHRYRAAPPTRAWLDAFEDLFERFHFVVRQADGPGIAPDMLGQVFEGVMESDHRLETGSFYTPAALVRDVVRAGLGALLATRLRVGEGAADRLIDDPSPGARAILESVTILDPAVGSGAFLVGALDILAAPWSGHPSAWARRRRAIVGRNLFGVDQNASAVRLAELRLWLDVIATDPAERPESVAPLPNLDALLRQGDALAGPRDLPGASSAGEAMGPLRRNLAVATGAEKRQLDRALRAAEHRAFEASLREATGRLEGRIRDLLAAARRPTLFGTATGLEREARARLRHLRRERAGYRALLRRLRREAVWPWFHFPSHFADVFAGAGGFDLVVGNPPWVRAERLAADQRSWLASRYTWWRGLRRGAGGYSHQPDLSVAFLERATELAAPGGTVAMLVPAKVATSGYAEAARVGLSGQTTLHVVAELGGGAPRAFDATVYPMALVFSKSLPPHGHEVRGALSGGERVPQSRLGGAPWVIVADPVRDALEEARGDHPRLENSFPCHLGLKTGCNRVFLDPEVGVEADLLRWAVRGRDITPFRTAPRSRLLWTHASNGDPLPALPPRATAWIARHRGRLLARRDYTGGPAWTLFRAHAAAAPHRVLWADLARRLEVAALTGPADATSIPLNSCYLVTPPSGAVALRLAAWLNSTWIRAVAALAADRAAGGFARFNARVVGGVPLPPSVPLDPDLMSLAERARQGATIQEELDDIAARHLALGPAHRRALAEHLAARAGAAR